MLNNTDNTYSKNQVTAKSEETQGLQISSFSYLLKRHICKTVFPLLFTKTFSEELISFDMENDYAKTNFLLTQVLQEMPKNL